MLDREKGIAGFTSVKQPVNFLFVLQLLLGLGFIMLPSLFSLFYVTGEFHRFLHRGRAELPETVICMLSIVS